MADIREDWYGKTLKDVQAEQDARHVNCECVDDDKVMSLNGDSRSRSCDTLAEFASLRRYGVLRQSAKSCEALLTTFAASTFPDPTSLHFTRPTFAQPRRNLTALPLDVTPHPSRSRRQMKGYTPPAPPPPHSNSANRDSLLV
jgi:hypothetical protein